MPQTNKTITEQKVIHAGLQVMTARESIKITLSDIAEKLDVSEKELYPFIQYPTDIFNLITRRANEKLAQTYESDPDTSKKDQYFDLIMERLDLLQPYKSDMERFSKAVRQKPLTMARFFSDFDRGITLMMELVGDGSKHHAKKMALIWVYLSTLRQWFKDDSDDSAKTMAHLDKCLQQLDALKQKAPSFKSRAA